MTGPPVPPPPPPRAAKKSFWRSPGGVAAVVGFSIAGVVMMGLLALGIALEMGVFPDTAVVPLNSVSMDGSFNTFFSIDLKCFASAVLIPAPPDW